MYIGRRADGTIYGAWKNKQPLDNFHTNIEEVADDNSEYLTFHQDMQNRMAVNPLATLTATVTSLQARLAILEQRLP